MAEPQRDLIAGLRRVDDAFAGLKPGRDDVMDRLLAGDTDELVRQSERRLAGRRQQRLLAGGLLTAAVVAVIALLPAPSSGPSARPSTVAATPSSMPPSPLPSPSPPTAASSVPSPSPPSPSSPSPGPALALRRPRVVAPGAAGSLVAVDGAGLSSLPLAPSPGLAPVTPTGAAGAVVDVASPLSLPSRSPPPGPGDDEVEQALREARAASDRGEFGAAADVLGALLARPTRERVAPTRERVAPTRERVAPTRVVDVVGVQRAALLARAGRIDEACAAWRSHREDFPASDNAVVVAAELARWSCR